MHIIEKLRQSLNLVDAHPGAWAQLAQPISERLWPRRQFLIEPFVEQIESMCQRKTLLDPCALTGPAQAKQKEALARWPKNARDLLFDYHAGIFRRIVTAIYTPVQRPSNAFA